MNDVQQMPVIQLAGVAPQPWRNGGGQTRELLTWPAGAATWQLRVSVADIDRDGPFSPFPGVQRCFTVLAGTGVVLTLGGSAHRLTPASAPLAFDGAAAPGCQLIDGPTRDLNLMATHAAGRAAMQPAQPGVPLPCGPGRRWQGLYTTTPARLQASGGERDLPADSLAWAIPLPGDAWCVLEQGGAALRAWWLTLDAELPT